MLDAGLQELQEQVLHCHDLAVQSRARRAFARLFRTEVRRELAQVFRLSPRETDALWYLMMGLKDQEISAQMGIRRCAASGFLTRVYAKMGVNCRERAIVKAILVSGQVRLGDGDEDGRE